MNIFQGIFKARDKPKDALGGSRYSFFLGRHKRRKAGK
jgi:hypothetical protein